MASDSPIQYSIVVPFFNEQENIPPLYMKLTEVMDGLGEPYELVFVDDGSKDDSFKVLSEIYEHDGRVNLVRLRKNFGQTAGLKAGFDFARGDVIISMDGDLQHDPAEIPAFIAKIHEGYDIVSGWRLQRRDAWLTRRLPSRTANWLMARLCGLDLHDFGTTFKAYRREIIKDLPLYGEMHRFIPALAAASGARIAEIPVTNPPRQFGKSNYGISRTFRVFLDLLSTKFWLDYSTKPMHFFGFFGLAATGTGILTGFLLLFQKVFARAAFASNATLAFATIALLLAGLQIMCMGFVSEILSRTYYESQKKPVYVTRPTGMPEMGLGSKYDVAGALGEDTGHESENLTNPSQSPWERPMLMVSADQPRVVRKIQRSRLV